MSADQASTSGKKKRNRGMTSFGNSAQRPAAKMRNDNSSSAPEHDDDQLTQCSTMFESASQMGSQAEPGFTSRTTAQLDMATCARIKAEAAKKKKNAGME